MTMFNPAETSLTPRGLGDEKEIGLAVVMPENGTLRCMLTVDGKTETFRVSRRVAASLVGEIAVALAKSA